MPLWHLDQMSVSVLTYFTFLYDTVKNEVSLELLYNAWSR